MQSHKKVLILDTGKEWGGGTNSLLELLKRIDKDKYHFTALFYSNYKKGNGPDIKTEIEKTGTDFLFLEQKKQPAVSKILKNLVRLFFFFSKELKKHFVFFVDYDFRIKQNARKIADILRELNIDLLYMNNQPSSNLEGIIASKMTGIPALQHCRIAVTLNSFESETANRFLRKIICVSNGVMDALIKSGVKPGICTVVHNGIAPDTNAVVPADEIRRQWGISNDDILIGTVGSLVKRKRMGDLIDAVSLLRGKDKLPIKCIIVGEGPEKDRLLSEAKKIGRAGEIIFAGFQADAVSYINAMDIFVLPSENEGLPRVILEAMLMGKPVIASDIAGPSELIGDGRTGFLVPVRRPDMIARSLLTLINDRDLPKNMGENARKDVINNFSIEKYMRGVENVFAEVLEN